MENIQITVRIEVRHTDSAYLAFIISFFYCTVSSVVIAEWLMDQEQIDIVCLQFFQRLFDRSFCFLVPCVCAPYFCRDEKLLSRKSAFFQGASDPFVISVCLSSINAAVAGLNRFQYAAFCLFRRCLIYSVS